MRRLAECGTEGAYRRHLQRREVADQACCDAHAVHMANWRARARVNPPLDPIRYQAARLGKEPAEALAPGDRARLVAELVAAGKTDVEIASLTRMTTYTTTRIRDWLGLPANARRRTRAA